MSQRKISNDARRALAAHRAAQGGGRRRVSSRGPAKKATPSKKSTKKLSNSARKAIALARAQRDYDSDDSDDYDDSDDDDEEDRPVSNSARKAIALARARRNYDSDDDNSDDEEEKSNCNCVISWTFIVFQRLLFSFSIVLVVHKRRSQPFLPHFNFDAGDFEQELEAK